MPGMIQPKRTLRRIDANTLEVTIPSPVTGKLSTMTLPVTMAAWNEWQAGQYIQAAMPDLCPEEREFLMSGMTEDDWAGMADEDDSES